MDETRRLILKNALGGVPSWRIAETLHVPESTVEQTVAGALHLVREWIASGFHPYFKLESIVDAQKNRLRFQAVLNEIEVWDQQTKPVAQMIFEGVPSGQVESRFGISRGLTTDFVTEAILKIGAFLKPEEVQELHANPGRWVKGNRYRAMALLERVPSAEGGKRLVRIEFQAVLVD